MSFDGFNSPPRSPKRRRVLASFNPVPAAPAVAPAKSPASEAVLDGHNARGIGGGVEGGSRSKRHRSREPEELGRGRSRSSSVAADALTKGSSKGSRKDRGDSHDRDIPMTGVEEDAVSGAGDGEGGHVPKRYRDTERNGEEEDRDSEGRRREKKPKVTKFRFKDKDRESRRRRRSRSRSPRSDRHRSRRHQSQEDDRDGRERERRRSRDRSRDRNRDRDRDRDRDEDPKDGESRRKHRHRHHHRRHRRHRSPTPREQEQQPPDPEQEDPFAEPPLDPEAAFRESLFDAMADDEGAAYWEGVYGQPIHVYSSARERVNPEGELERMTDEEYAAYVRQRMWEKTHQGLLEEKERRQKRKEEERRREEEERRIAKEMERSLKRGEERRKRRVWKDRWEEYLKAWQDLAIAAATASAAEGGKKFDAEKIPWPVNREVLPGGKIEEMDPETVRAFFVHGIGLEELGEKEFAVRLKDERVRWHPDKMQQRLGGNVDATIMRDVTAIFQIVDRLWNDTRKSS